jgi:Leucine-rich repeat (LRR) protein
MENYADWEYLENVFLCNNKIVKLDPLCYFMSIRILDASNNLISTFDHIALPCLQVLNLSGNKLKAFPHFGCKMLHLRVIDLSFNDLETVVIDTCQIKTCLEELYLEGQYGLKFATPRDMIVFLKQVRMLKLLTRFSFDNNVLKAANHRAMNDLLNNLPVGVKSYNGLPFEFL